MKEPKESEPLIKRHTKKVTVGGKDYRLIHPGMRFHTKWRRECSEVKDGRIIFDLEKFLDYAFEYCVEPIDHTFMPTQDNILDPKEQEEWSRLLPRFLRGDSVENTNGKVEKEGPSKAS